MSRRLWSRPRAHDGRARRLRDWRARPRRPDGFCPPMPGCGSARSGPSCKRSQSGTATRMCLKWPRQFTRGAEQQKGRVAPAPAIVLRREAGVSRAAAAFQTGLVGAMARVIIGTRMLRACREAARKGIRSRCDGNSQAQGGKSGKDTKPRKYREPEELPPDAEADARVQAFFQRMIQPRSG
jgi:hypothetical protein